MKKTSFSIFFIFILFLACFCSVSAQQNTVVLVDITDEIDQSTVDIVTEALHEAQDLNSQAVVLLIDTPGGGLQQTFTIAELIKDSPIPVVGYVYPSGATAWSAGTFILLSTHVAAMADHTIIGSCQPVEISFAGTQTINDSKTINALTEWIQERANMYGRNATLAKEFITKNRNVNATQAYEYGVIEYKASTIDELLNTIDGLNVTTVNRNVTLHTMGAEQIQYTPSLKIQLTKFIANPILSSLLLILGIFALIFGISTPGHGAEVLGAIAILLSLIGYGFSLPVVSIIFIIIGCLLLIIEIFAIPGFGIVGIGGAICLALGSIFLIPSYPTREWLISREYMTDALLITIVVFVFMACFFAFLLYKVLQIRKKRISIGLLVGETAITVDQITPEKTGYVRFKGELWQAKSEKTIEPNTKVIIVRKDETILIVKQKD
jgi:membrane-bound serine protease (ClpP class)